MFAFVEMMILAVVSHGPLALADSSFTLMDYENARSAYEVLLQQDSTDAEVLWRLARVSICMGDTADRSRREPYYRSAVQFARAGIAANDSLGECHTWLAASLGNIAMYEGSRTKVELAGEIKNELDRAIALNPGDDVAWSILGSFYRALGSVNWLERNLARILYGSLPDGGFEDAEAALEKAIALAPNVIRHQFELGMVYVDEGEDEKALTVFEKAITLPVTRVSDHRAIRRMKRMIDRIRGIEE
jgi:tetratricopeptide (TPR) repeat protein